MLNRFFYWPRSPEYALPWLLGPVLYLLLGAFGLPFGKPSNIDSVSASLCDCLLAMLFLFSLNALFLWTHMRPQFLTWSTGRVRFCGTLLLLTLGYLLLWGTVLAVQGRARPTLNPANIDWLFTAERTDLGLLGLTTILLVSAVWKSEEPGVGNLRLERDKARRLVGRLLEGIDTEEYNDLEPTLSQLEDSARSLMGRLSEENLALLRVWSKAAKDLRESIRGLDYNDLSRIRQHPGKIVESTLNLLNRTK